MDNATTTIRLLALIAAKGNRDKVDEIITWASNPPAEKVDNPRQKSENLSPKEFVDLWNARRGACPGVTRITDERRRKIALRIREMGCDDIEQRDTLKRVMNVVNSSQFLQGFNSKGWKADLDWLIANSNNWVKTLEGKYNGSPRNSTDEYAAFFGR